MNAPGERQLLADVPADVVERQDARPVLVGCGALGKGIEDALEQRDIDGAGEPPFDLPVARPDEGVEIEPFVIQPFVFVGVRGNLSLSDPGPGALIKVGCPGPQDGFRPAASGRGGAR